MSNSTDIKTFDATTLQKLLDLAGKYGPYVFALVQELIALLSKQAVISARPGERSDELCDDACKCLAAAQKHQLEALAHIVHLRCCCSPSNK